MTMMSIDAVLPWIGGIGIFVSERVVVSPATTGSVVGVGGAGFATADGLAATAADGDAAGEAAADAAGLTAGEGEAAATHVLRRENLQEVPVCFLIDFRDATGDMVLSKSAVSEITDRLWEDYQAFITRDLSDIAVEYQFVDAVFLVAASPRGQGGGVGRLVHRLRRA